MGIYSNEQGLPKEYPNLSSLTATQLSHIQAAAVGLNNHSGKVTKLSKLGREESGYKVGNLGFYVKAYRSRTNKAPRIGQLKTTVVFAEPAGTFHFDACTGITSNPISL